MQKRYRVEIEQEEDGRWLADVEDLPGVMAWEEIAPRMLARIAKRPGLRPEDL